jgi:molybdopterin converting factor small subunit
MSSKVRQFCAQHQLRALRQICSRALAARCAAGYNSWVTPVAPSNVKASIRVKALFFGGLKEVAGRAEETVELASGSHIEDLFAQFISRCPELARYRGSLVASRNQEFAAWNTPLESGDEIAFLPPVSGG